MSLSLLEKRKLEFLEVRLGTMTSVQALEIATGADQTCRDIGPFDIAFERFKQEELTFTEYALLLEKRENSQSQTNAL